MIDSKILRVLFTSAMSKNTGWSFQNSALDVEFSSQVTTLLSDSTILISGSKGFIGKNLWDLLIQAVKLGMIQPRKIVRISRTPFANASESINGVPLHSITNQDFLSNPFEIDFLFHLASPSNITKIQSVDDVLIPNTTFLLDILKYVTRHTLYFSSSEVYRLLSVRAAAKFPSEITSDKRNWYPASKIAGENVCQVWFNTNSGRKLSIIRLFHTYGPGLDKNDGRSFADFLWQGVLNDKITLKSNGLQKRTFLYVSDALSALLTLLHARHSGFEVVDIGSDREITILDFAKIVGEVTNRNVDIKIDNSFLHSRDSALVPNLARIRELGWAEKVELELGIEKTLKHMRESVL